MAMIELTEDEVEDARFALARLAKLDNEKAAIAGGLAPALIEQAERFRLLARKLASAE